MKEEEEVEFPWSSEEGLTPWHCPFCKVTVKTAIMEPEWSLNRALIEP